MKPAKPNPPIIKVCKPTEITKVDCEVMVPESTCSIKSPIIAWRVFGYGADNEEIGFIHNLDEAQFTDKLSNFTLEHLNPDQQYTLQVLAYC